MKKILIGLFSYASIMLTLTLTCPICQASSKSDVFKDDSKFDVQSENILKIGSRLELFVDDYLIDHLGGKANLRLHQPEPKEIVLYHDKPREGSGSGKYRSIFKDGDKYRKYYTVSHIPVIDGKIERPHLYCAYAESYDGINWHKPNLGLYDFQGSKDNNIVFIRGLMDGVEACGGHQAVFKDENPNVSPDALYKAILVFRGGKRGLVAFKSPDGINWTPMTDYPVITDGAFDSQNLAFWDEERGEYRAYWRYFTEGTDESPYTGIRSIRTARSDDMINWYDQQDLVYVDSPDEHLYTNQIKPYYRAPHILIGFPARYIDRGWSESTKVLPNLEHRELRSTAQERYGTAFTEGLFMASRDGVLFKRWNEAFFCPGIEREGTWKYGHHYIGWSVVETESSLEGAPNELSFYSSESYWTDPGSVSRRYTLRIDGFVSVNAPMSGGEFVTKPLTFTGNNLILNFSSSAAGDIKVEIQDENGRPLPGYSLNDCPPIFGDTIERVVTWKNGSDLSSLEGKPIRLRFVLKDADLYSLRFR